VYPTSEGSRQEPAALDAASIQCLLNNPELPLQIEASVGSTNSRLAEKRHRGESLRVLLAEQQTAGRGRHGRQWLSPPGRGLYLSMAWESSRPARSLSALALVAGLAAAAAVAQHSRVQVGVKWPNDLQVNGRKLGGCLIDLGQVRGARVHAIIGIGINVNLAGLGGPDQPWTDLVTEGGSGDRNRLAAILINTLERDLGLFDRNGIEAFRSRWDAHDVLRGQRLRLTGSGADIEGRGVGIDPSGALLLETAAGIQAIHAGEVSVRRLDPLCCGTGYPLQR